MALAFVGATAVFLVVPAEDLLRLGNPLFWVMKGLTLLGSVAGQMRNIAMSACVTLLVSEERRDRCTCGASTSRSRCRPPTGRRRASTCVAHWSRSGPCPG
jgi:hypothetical protein